MIRPTFPDLTSLWHRAARLMLTARGPSAPTASSTGKGPVENLFVHEPLAGEHGLCSSMWDDDLSLNRSRFTTLQRSYLHPEDLDAFLARVEVIGRIHRRGAY